MQTASPSIAAWLACVALALGLGACAEQKPVQADLLPSGKMSLQLALSEDANLSSLTYEIVAPDMDPVTGEFNVSGVTGSFSAVIAGIPAGTGRTLTLRATADEGTSCEGSVVFDVIADQTTAVHVALTCGDMPGRGSVSVDGSIEYCPTIAAVSALPSAVQVGESIQVAVGTASGSIAPDFSEWTAGAGSFADPLALATTYLCEVAGPQILTFSATDNSGCSDAVSVEVTCLDDGSSQEHCGNGIVEGNEECDGGAGCSDDSTLIGEAVCGNGLVEAPELCDGDCPTSCASDTACATTVLVGSASSCDAECVATPITEAIDGDGCCPAGTTSATDNDCAAECGNGVVEGSEECDGSEGCNADCTLATVDADLVGTWLTEQTVFDTTLTAPLVGDADAVITLSLITWVQANGQVSTQICTMDIEENAIGLEFLSSVQEIQTPSPVTAPTLTLPVGDTFPFTAFTLEADGLQVRANAIGFDLVVDLVVDVEVSAALDDLTSASGTTSFSSDSNVFLGITPVGTMTIPAGGDPIPTAPVTIVKVSGESDLSCEAAAALL